MVDNKAVNSIAKYAKERGMTAADLREVNEKHWQSFPDKSPQRYIGFMRQIEGCYDEAEIEAAAALIE